MAITAAAVNELRKMTGAGMMDCKKALQESNGDTQGAIDILRLKGQKISANRADRDATEGAVIAKSSSDNTTGVIVRLSCETDFVAKNDDFVSLANELAELALANNADSLDAFKAMPYEGSTVAEKLVNEMGKIGEKIDVSKYAYVAGEAVSAYIHAGNKIGVLVKMNRAANDVNIAAGKDAAMQIAAMNPVAVDENGVAEDVKERELAIGREQAISEGKPEQIVDKIAQGKLKRFYKDNTLLNQPFVKDSSRTVGQMLNDIENGLTITQFERIALG
jgi:elongation factor Ts